MPVIKIVHDAVEELIQFNCIESPAVKVVKMILKFLLVDLKLSEFSLVYRKSADQEMHLIQNNQELHSLIEPLTDEDVLEIVVKNAKTSEMSTIAIHPLESVSKQCVSSPSTSSSSTSSEDMSGSESSSVYCDSNASADFQQVQLFTPQPYTPVLPLLLFTHSGGVNYYPMSIVSTPTTQLLPWGFDPRLISHRVTSHVSYINSNMSMDWTSQPTATTYSSIHNRQAYAQQSHGVINEVQFVTQCLNYPFYQMVPSFPMPNYCATLPLLLPTQDSWTNVPYIALSSPQPFAVSRFVSMSQMSVYDLHYSDWDNSTVTSNDVSTVFNSTSTTTTTTVSRRRHSSKVRTAYPALLCYEPEPPRKEVHNLYYRPNRKPPAVIPATTTDSDKVISTPIAV